MPYHETIVTRRAWKSAGKFGQSRNASYSGIHGNKLTRRRQVSNADAIFRKWSGLPYRIARESFTLANRVPLWHASDKVGYRKQTTGTEEE